MPKHNQLLNEVAIRLAATQNRDSLYIREMPTFPDFVTDILKQPRLFARQRQVFEDSIGLDPETYFGNRKNNCQEIVLAWGKGSGKDLITSYLVTYWAYLLLNMRDMHATLGMPAGEEIDIITVAASQTQATNILFKKITTWLKKDMFTPFKPKISSGAVDFESWHLRIFAFHSKADTYEGYNPVLWVMDEASAFRDTSDHSNAQVVHNTLSSSSKSRYLTNSLGVVISFPRREGDFILKQAELAKFTPSMYSDVAATWDVREDRLISDFADEIRKDSNFAMCVFGCKPPAGFGKWFDDQTALKAAFRVNLADVLWAPTTTHTGDPPITKRGIEIISTRVNPDAKYILHCDPGWKVDSFAAAFGYHEEILSNNSGAPVTVDTVKVTGILRWEPDAELHIPVDMQDVQRTLVELHKVFNFEDMTFDQFQSAMLIQQLQEKGLPARALNFSGPQQLGMYRVLRQAVNAQTIQICEDDVTLREAIELERRNTRPDHPSTGSKDCIDCVASITFNIMSRAMSGHRTQSKPSLEQLRFNLNDYVGFK